MIDPHTLIDPQAAAMPAPVWFVQFFKALGFLLHVVPMNLWYAGLPIALLLSAFGGEDAQRFSRRLLKQMPVVVAVGINLGIVPLLFVQLAYHKFFYPATTLMAWYWLSIIAMLIPAYYGIYAYAWGFRIFPFSSERGGGGASQAGEMGAGKQKKNTPDALTLTLSQRERGPASWRVAAGWIAALLFLCIGFLFANGLSLMDHVGRWPELWVAHQVGGAATGTALNLSDPTLWPRWLLMFGLALCTTAVWALVDAEWLGGGKGSSERNRWAWRFARILYALGIVWTAGAGAWYVFGTWSDPLRTAMFAWPWIMLTVATALSPGMPWLLMMIGGRVALVAVAHLGVLGLNVAARQVVQNMNLKPYYDVYAQPTAVEWSPMALFLTAFVFMVAVVGWMIVKIARNPTP